MIFYLNRYSQKKVSRIASELPKNVFTTQRSLDFLPPPESLKELLEEFKLESYIPRFEQQGIDLTAFLELTDGDLKDMGVEYVVELFICFLTFCLL